MLKITLKRDRERSLLRRHPWVFSGAIDKIHGDPQVGDTVSVFANDGRFLGHGAWNPVSNIRVRIWAWQEDTRIDADFFATRLAAAIAMRARLLPTPPAGELAANADGAVPDNCIASCVDWYGNARPIFLGTRTFALMGYERVEGRLGDGRIREVGRLDFAPGPAKKED